MLKRLGAILVGCLIATQAPIVAAEDIDLFKTPTTTAANRPNVLIIWDNTANWSQSITGGTAYEVEKEALKTVIEGLNDNINVGLMMFTESGSPNTNTKGGYIRYAIRQMTGSNKSDLKNLVDGLHTNNDKGNAAFFATAMHEAFLYFKGTTSYVGAGQKKRDAQAFDPAVTAVVGPDGAKYMSPISADNNCANNYIVFIGNGSPDSGENTDSQARLTALGGKLTSDPVALTPSNDQANWLDEYARYMQRTDLRPDLLDKQKVTTYTLAVHDPAKASLNATKSYLALMKSAAALGGGKSYVASSASQIAESLTSIFKEIQAVDTAFASVTLPISVNVRGTNLNQVYIGVFRADADGSPRWPGNLKLFQLAHDTVTDKLFLADRFGTAAESTTTGFLTDGAVSFWTTPTSFWGFKYPDAVSDQPDGPFVEKGAFAHRLRTIHASDLSGRKMYTCIGCSSTTDLSAGAAAAGASTAFSTDNTSLTTTLLGAADAAERTSIINWVRGQDLDDENNNSSTAGMRPYPVGDVLHSQPAVVNYNRYGDDNDLVVYVGANDGFLHAIKGGKADSDGSPLWSFVPEEFLSKLKRQRKDTPDIFTGGKPYFVDGGISVYQHDANSDGRFVAADGDKVYLFVSMRRGGRMIYAFDVSDPVTPRFMWKGGCPNLNDNTGCSSGFEELGQTWSMPKTTAVKNGDGSKRPVLVFGGGYDPAAEDIDPATITAISSGTPDGVTYTPASSPSTTVLRSKGRAIFVVDALTGAIVWRAGVSGVATTANSTHSDMKFSIPADLAVMERTRYSSNDGIVDRIYAGDTGGQVWRVDFVDPADVATWRVRRVAQLDLSTTARRKFLFSPDIVFGRDANGPYDAILIGSGDREQPFAKTVVDRFYMIKDRSVTAPAGSGTLADYNIMESNLYDATANTIQDGTTVETRTAAEAALLSSEGWYVTLGGLGEKVVSGVVVWNGGVFFNTNTPTPPTPGACTGSLGTARQYQMDYRNATAVANYDGTAGLTAADRSQVLAGGGFKPTPVPTVVQIGDRLREAVIIGTHVEKPVGVPLQRRFKTYWNKRMDRK